MVVVVGPGPTGGGGGADLFNEKAQYNPAARLGIHQRGVQSEGGAVDGGSII